MFIRGSYYSFAAFWSDWYLRKLSSALAQNALGAQVLSDLEHMRGMMAGPLPPTPLTPRDFVLAMVKGKKGHLSIKAGDAQRARSLETVYDGPRPTGYEQSKKEGAIVLGVGGDNSPWGAGVFFEGALLGGTLRV